MGGVRCCEYPLDACSCGPRAGVCSERLELNMRVGYLRGGLRTFGLSARTHEKQRKGSIQRSASVRSVWSNARAGVNVNRVDVNGRSYVGSDSPGAAASALGSSYPIPLHGVSRNGMCMCPIMATSPRDFSPCDLNSPGLHFLPQNIQLKIRSWEDISPCKPK